MTTREIRRFQRLLKAHEAGVVTLPEEIIEAHKVVERTRVQLGKVVAQLDFSPSDDEITEIAAQAFAAAMVEGDALPSSDAWLEIKTNNQRLQFLHRALTRAEEIADANFGEVVLDRVDDVIKNHLRPAHDAIILEARKIAPKFDGVPSLAQAMQSESRRKAWLTLVDLANRYSTLRSAYGFFLRATGVQVEEQGTFSELRDGDRYRIPGGALSLPVADMEPPARLVWVATQAEPWMPTAAELAERATVFLRESGELDRRQRNQTVHAMRG